MSDDDWHSVININLNGVYNLCKYVVPVMREQESGAIVNMSSTSMMGNPGQCNYSATKAAMQGVTRTLAKELGGKGVRVNCVAPGVIKTDMLDALPAEVLPQLAEETPLRRLGTPEDIAHLAVFLASEKSSFITGQVITADGGFIV
jgi:3-oxoacyl-[acyl-carrier protein] reductase